MQSEYLSNFQMIWTERFNGCSILIKRADPQLTIYWQFHTLIFGIESENWKSMKVTCNEEMINFENENKDMSWLKRIFKESLKNLKNEKIIFEIKNKDFICFICKQVEEQRVVEVD